MTEFFSNVLSRTSRPQLDPDGWGKGELGAPRAILFAVLVVCNVTNVTLWLKSPKSHLNQL